MATGAVYVKSKIRANALEEYGLLGNDMISFKVTIIRYHAWLPPVFVEILYVPTSA